MQQLTPKTFFSTINHGITLVEFSGTWCQPCQMLEPVLAKLAAELSQIKVAQVDVGRYQALAQQFKVQSVPTMLLFVDGVAREKITGYRPYQPLKDYLLKRYHHYTKDEA